MWPFRKRHPLLVPVAKGKIPSFARSSGYTLGEAEAGRPVLAVVPS